MPSSNSNNNKSCLLLPHGSYSLLTASLTTMGWIAALFEDNCNYAKITGLTLAASGDAPYLQAGLQAYRAPVYNPDTMHWDPNVSGACVAYPSNLETSDAAWNLARALSFAGLVLGGGATFYLWISTCCKFTRGSWRWAGYEVGAACLCQALSFVWFRTTVCREMSCTMFYGAVADVLSTVFWFVAAVLIFVHYPAPKELLGGDGIVIVDDAEDEDSAVKDSNTPATVTKSQQKPDVEQALARQTSGETSDERSRFTIGEENDMDELQIT